MKVACKAFGIAVLLAAMAASATTIERISVERLTRESHRIVVGTVQRTWSQWNPEQTRIYTYSQVQVQQTWKGEPSSSIIVRQPGGVAGGYRQQVHGVKLLQKGEEAVLFLRGTAAGEFQVTALMQGQFQVSRTPTGEATVLNAAGPGHIEAFDRATGKFRSYHRQRMTLRALEQRVRRAMVQ